MYLFMIKLIYKIKREEAPYEQERINKSWQLVNQYFCTRGGGQKSNLSIINNNINKDYEITNRNISDFS